MPRTLTRLAAAAALTAAAWATTSSPAAAQEAEPRIHLLHGIPDTPVDVEAGGETVFEGFEFGDTQDLSALAGQTLTGLQVKAAGTDTVAIDAGDVTLPDSGNHTIVAHLDAEGDPALAVFTNDTSAIAAGQGRLTVRHAAAAPAVDVLANGSPAFTNVVNGDEGATDLPVGTISASVVPTGATEPVVIGPADLAIEDGTSLIVYAVGSLDGDSLTVLTETITGLGTAPAAIQTGNTPVSDEANGISAAVLAAMAVLLGAGALGVGRLATARTR
ncbi:MAG: DUF4397 domain-containing protein [Actinomycetota bacterium]